MEVLYSLCNKVQYFKEFAVIVELELLLWSLRRNFIVATRIPLKHVYRHFESIVADRM